MQATPSRVVYRDGENHVKKSSPKPKLLDQVRQTIRAWHYSKRTEKTYVDWIKRFILFHGKRHPMEMGEPEINQFLTDLAVAKRVSASTQNQALSAILFLYQRVMDKPFEWVNPAVRVKKPKRLPVVHETVVQKAMRQAVLQSGIGKPATPHVLRHSFATNFAGRRL